MAKSGKLSQVEKMAIQGGLHEKQSLKEIAEALGRTEKSIQGYVDGELDRIADTIAKIEIENYVAPIEDCGGEICKKSIVSKTYNQLVAAGVTEGDAEKLLRKTLEKANQHRKKPYENSDELFTECVKQMKAGNFLLKKTAGGAEGVAIMSPAASVRSDDAREKIGRKKTVSRHSSGNIFNPKTKKFY